MVNYREILRLSALKHVQRDICSAMHCSDHTVRAAVSYTHLTLPTTLGV